MMNLAKRSACTPRSCIRVFEQVASKTLRTNERSRGLRWWPVRLGSVCIEFSRLEQWKG
ncbi:hypothetical protein BLJAPNOD_02458 [Ensifer sp. M14]|nr:hypothetical protein BLJAPNOD_02458 [Ensifer sp. M14]